MKDRILALRRSLNLTQQAFADRLGIKRTTIANYELGRNDPVDSVVSLICREFGVREEWLRTGEGPMKSDSGVSAEMTALVDQLFRDRPESFKARLISALLRFDPDGPQWRILEDIYSSVAAEAPPSEDAERAALHIELERQLDAEKRGASA